MPKFKAFAKSENPLGKSSSCKDSKPAEDTQKFCPEDASPEGGPEAFFIGTDIESGMSSVGGGECSLWDSLAERPGSLGTEFVEGGNSLNCEDSTASNFQLQDTDNPASVTATTTQKNLSTQIHDVLKKAHKTVFGSKLESSVQKGGSSESKNFLGHGANSTIGTNISTIPEGEDEPDEEADSTKNNLNTATLIDATGESSERRAFSSRRKASRKASKKVNAKENNLSTQFNVFETLMGSTDSQATSQTDVLESRAGFGIFETSISDKSMKQTNIINRSSLKPHSEITSATPSQIDSQCNSLEPSTLTPSVYEPIDVNELLGGLESWPNPEIETVERDIVPRDVKGRSHAKNDNLITSPAQRSEPTIPSLRAFRKSLKKSSQTQNLDTRPVEESTIFIRGLFLGFEIRVR